MTHWLVTIWLVAQPTPAELEANLLRWLTPTPRELADRQRLDREYHWDERMEALKLARQRRRPDA